jgi:hypothetical protein
MGCWSACRSRPSWAAMSSRTGQPTRSLTASAATFARHDHDHTRLPDQVGHRHTAIRRADPQRDAEAAFNQLNLGYGVPADRVNRIGHYDVQQREAALALGVRVAVHDSRQNDRAPVIWQPDQDYRMADALQAARTRPTRTRQGPERLGPER